MKMKETEATALGIALQAIAETGVESRLVIGDEIYYLNAYVTPTAVTGYRRMIFFTTEPISEAEMEEAWNDE